MADAKKKDLEEFRKQVLAAQKMQSGAAVTGEDLRNAYKARYGTEFQTPAEKRASAFSTLNTDTQNMITAAFGGNDYMKDINGNASPFVVGGLASQRKRQDYVTGLNDKELDEAIRTNKPKYTAWGVLSALDKPSSTYDALVKEKQTRTNAKEYETKQQKINRYAEYSDEELQKMIEENDRKIQQVAASEGADSPNMQQYSKDADEMREVQQYRKQEAKEKEAAERQNQTEQWYEDAQKELDALPEADRAVLDELINQSDAAGDTDFLRRASGASYVPGYGEKLSDARETRQKLRDLGYTDEQINDLVTKGQYLKDRAETEEMQTQIEEDIQTGSPAARAGKTIAADAARVFMRPVEQIEGVLNTSRAFMADDGRPVNTYGNSYGAQNTGKALASGANQNTLNATDNDVVNYALYLVNNGVTESLASAYSMALSTMAAAPIAGAAGGSEAILKGVSEAINLTGMGASSFSQTFQDAQERGLTRKEALTEAAAYGGIEAASELLPLESMWGIFTNSGEKEVKKLVSRALLDAAKQAGVEGMEEAVADIGDEIADRIIAGGSAEYYQNKRNYMQQGYTEAEAAQMASNDFWKSVAEDFVIGTISGGLGGGAASNISSAVQYKKLGKNTLSNPELAAQVIETAKNTDPGSDAYRIANEKTADQMTADEMGSVLVSLTEQSEGSIEDVLTESFVERGESEKQAREDARELMKAAASEEVSEEESNARAERFEQNENLPEVYGELMQGNLTPVNNTLSEVQRAYRNRNNTIDNVKAVVQDQSGAYVLKMKNGDTVKADQMNIPEGDTDTKALLGWAISESSSPQEATQILENRPKDMPYAQYKTAFKGIMSAAMEDVPLNQVKQSFSAYTDRMTDAQVQSIYAFGQNRAQERAEQNLTGDQVAAADALAKAAGIKVQIGGRDLSGSNGIFAPETGVIYVSDKTLNPAAVVVGHEVVHKMKAEDTESFNKLSDTLIKYWKENDPETYKTIYENRERRYRDQVKEWREKGYSEKEINDLIEEEIVAHATEALFEKWGNMDESEKEDLAERMVKDDRTLVQKILDFVRELIGKIEKALKGYKANSLEARTLSKDLALLDDFEQTFTEALAQFGTKNRAEGKESGVVDARNRENESDKGSSAEIRKSRKEVNYRNAVDQDVLAFIKEVQSGNADKKSYITLEQRIAKKLGNEISEIVGFQVSGYKAEIDKNGIAHIEKEHGENGRTDQSMSNPEDIARIGYVIRNYDKVRKGNEKGKAGGYKNSDGTVAQTVELQKDVGNNYYYAVIAVPDSNKKILHVVSAYINKKDTFPEMAVPKGSSRYVRNGFQSNVSPDLNVSRDDGKSNTEREKKGENSKKTRSGKETRHSLKEVGEDNEGAKLTDDQIEYFKGSKIVDEEGKLVVVYHGTSEDFTVFDRTKGRSNMDIQGSFFSPWEIDAQGYGSKVQKYYLNITNPAPEGTAYKALNRFKGQNNAGIKAREYLESLGYDGVNNSDEEYIAFYPEQIKRTDNEHPTKNEDVRYSKKEMEEAEEKLSGQLNDWRHGKMPENGYFDIGMTPYALTKWGVPHLPIIMDEDVILKFTTDYKDHAVALDDVAHLPSEIANPLFLFKGSVKNSVVVVTELEDKSGDSVIVAVHLNRRRLRAKINRIASIYGKRNIENYIGRQIKEGNLIDYDKKRSELWASIRGLQLPKMVQSSQLASKENITSSDEKSNNKTPMLSKKEIEDVNEVFDQEAQRLGEVGFMDIIRQISMKDAEKYVNYAAMRKIAKTLKDDYDSNIKLDDLTAMLNQTFAHWASQGNKANTTDIVRSMVGIARPLMEQTKTMDVSTEQEYKNLISSLRGKRIKLNDAQKEEIKNVYDKLNVYRGKTMPYFTISEDGIPLDNLWSELVQESGYMLDESETDANQPIALLDVLNTLKPKMGLAMYEEAGMDEAQMAVDIALDIYGRFFRYVSDQTSNKDLKDKIQRITNNRIEYRKQIKDEYQRRYDTLVQREQAKRERDQEIFEWELEKAKEQYKIAKSRNDDKAQERYQKMVERYEDRIKKLSDKNNEKILEIRARYQNTNSQRKVNQEIQKKRQSVIRTANAIGTLLKTNTDKKHVPEALKQPVYDFISGVKYFRETGHDAPSTKAELEWAEKLEKMRLMLGDWSEADAKGYTQLWHTLMDTSDENGAQVSSLLTDMDTFLKKNGSVSMVEMGVDQLTELNELMKGLKRAIDNMNQLYVNKRTQNLQEIGDANIEDLSKKKSIHNMTKLGSVANELLNVSQLDARSYFHRLGPAAESVYGGFRDAQNNWIRMTMQATDYMKEKIGDAKIRKWSTDTHEFEFGGKKRTFTTAQIMSIYELMKRKQAEEHIIFGGVKPADYKKGAKTITQEKIRISLQEAAEITGVLTDEQKRIADDIQYFMNYQAAEWGNKTTMLLYGYKRFLAKDYFPIAVDKDTVDTQETSRLSGARTPGITKETKEHARNALIAKDIFDVFTEHVATMATYAAYSPAIMDARKWYDYRLSPDSEILENDPDVNPSIKGQIRRVYGADMVKYFENLLADINNERKADTAGTGLYDMLLGNAKAAAIAGNVRVVVQQPTAYARAMAVISPKYLTQALFTTKGSKNALEHSAIAQWKSAGHWETSIASSMKSEITGQKSARENINEALLWLAGKADDVTWGKLWNAVELETKDLHEDVAVGSEEFYKLCEERFDDIIDQTQVVDSTLHRSQIMRSKNGITKALTSFMAEPTKSYNLLMNRARDWYEAMRAGDKEAARAAAKHLTRAAAAFLFTAALNAGAQSLWDAVRGAGDEDEDIDDAEERWLAYWERFLEAYTENLTDNINPLNLLPYAKDLISILQGFSASNLNSQGLEKTVAGAKKLMKYFSDEDYRKKNTFYESARGVIQGVSYIAGVPFYNVMRDAAAIYETATGKKFGGRVYTATQKKDKLATALVEGDTEKVEAMTEQLESEGKEEKDIITDAKGGLTQQYKDGKINEQQYEEALIDIGMSETDAYFTVREQQYKKENGEDASYSRYRELAKLLLEGDTKGFEALRDEFLSAGLEADKIKSQTAGKITEQVKEDIKNGTLNSEKQAEYLSMYQRLGYDREKKLKDIQKLIQEHKDGKW